MMCRIADLKALSGLKIRAVFDDGKTVLYDVGEDVDTIAAFTPLREVPGLFQQAMLDPSRTCVYWNDQIDLPSDAIYEYGKECAKSPATK